MTYWQDTRDGRTDRAHYSILRLTGDGMAALFLHNPKPQDGG